MYIAEIAPAAKRGRLVGMFQFNIVAGILLAYFSNYVIGTLGLGATEWRWKLGVAALPAVLFLLRAARHSAEPALAGAPRADGGSARRAGAHRRAGAGREVRDIANRVQERKPHRPASPCSRRSTGSRFSWRSRSACSTSSPASTRSSTTPTIFSRRRASAKRRAICRRWRSASAT